MINYARINITFDLHLTYSQSDNIFRSDIRSPVFSRKSFVCTTSSPSHGRSSPVTPIVLPNSKNIHNRSMRCNSVSSSSSNVDRVSKPAYLVVSSCDSATNISKYPKFTPTSSNSLDSSTSRFCVVSHRNIHRKRKHCVKRVIRSSLVNSTNSHDITSKLIVGRDNINVITKPGNYYISSILFIRIILGVFNIRNFY